MSAVPTSADPLAETPCFLGGRDRDDFAYDLMAGDARVLDGNPESPRSDRVVTSMRVNDETGS